MKKGIKTSMYYNDGTTVTDYDKLRRHGYTCADYQLIADTKCVLYKVDEAEFKKMMLDEKKRADKAGVEFSQVHAPWPVDDTTPEKRAVTMENMKKAVRGTAYLDGKYLVVHPVMPYGWYRDDDPLYSEKLNAEFFEELSKYAMKYNVRICIENMPFKTKISPMSETIKFVEKYNIQNLYICMDTGHCIVHNEDCGEMIRRAGDKLKVFHLHDNVGYIDNHQIPYSGKIDWDSFKSAIRDVKFDGCLSSEADVSRKLPAALREYMEIGLSKIISSLDCEIDEEEI